MMKFSAFILIVTCSLSIYAQNSYTLSGTVIKSNDIPLDAYGALLLDDSCAFHVVDNLGKVIIPDVYGWNFGVEIEQGDYVEVKAAVALDYGIVINSLAGYGSSGPKYKRYTIENDSSVYFKGKVTFSGEYQGRKIQLDKDFYMNLLPSLPKVRVLDVTWSNYDAQWNIYDDAYMTIQITSDRMENIYCLEQDVSFTGHAMSSFFTADIDARKGIGLLPFYDGDRCFRFFSYNFSGTVECEDTLYTAKVATSIPPSIKMKNVPFYPNPVENVLFVQDGMSDIFPLSIYDSKGRLVKYVGVSMSEIDVSNLMQGVYFVLYRNKSSQGKATFKMMKE